MYSMPILKSYLEDEEEAKRYFIGCFADAHGYSCCLASLHENKIQIIADKYYYAFVSFQLIKKAIEDLIVLTGNSYAEGLFFYDLPSLRDYFESDSFQYPRLLCEYFYPIAFEAEFPSNEALKLQALLIDKNLLLFEDLKSELKNFNLYDRKVNKRLCAVFTLLRDFERNVGGVI